MDVRALRTLPVPEQIERQQLWRGQYPVFARFCSVKHANAGPGAEASEETILSEQPLT